MTGYRTSPRRTLLDRVFGIGLILFLLYVAQLSFSGQLGEKTRALVDWIGSFFP